MIKTDLAWPEGPEEILSEYLCDHPGCHNIATEALGCIRELGQMAMVCPDHIPGRT